MNAMDFETLNYIEVQLSEKIYLRLPSVDGILSEYPFFLVVFGFIFILIFLIRGYSQYALSRKLGISKSWMAWIPILSFFNKLSIAEKKYIWGIKWYIVSFLLLVILPYGLFLRLFIEYSTITYPIESFEERYHGKSIMGIFFSIWLIIFFISQYRLHKSISTRIGGGKLWTFGLLLAGWLFWPITAIYYQFSKEVKPKILSDGRVLLLLLSGLLLPISFILYFLITVTTGNQSTHLVNKEDLPTSSNFNQNLESLRDVARISHMGQISTGLSSYYADMEIYPSTPESGCFSDNVLSTSYTYTTNKTIDPIPTNITPGCDGSDGTYVYRSLAGEDGTPGFVVGAKMENKRGGNSNLPIEEITPNTILMKGSGPYYYMVR